MAHRVTSSMDFYKFCLVAFLIFNNGFPTKGVPDEQTSGTKTPSVRECRAHIEAALDKYWDTNEGGGDTDQGATPGYTPTTTDHSDEILNTGPESEDETDQDDETDPPVDVHSQEETPELGDDDDDEDNDEDDEEDDESEVDEEELRPTKVVSVESNETIEHVDQISETEEDDVDDEDEEDETEEDDEEQVENMENAKDDDEDDEEIEDETVDVKQIDDITSGKSENFSESTSLVSGVEDAVTSRSESVEHVEDHEEQDENVEDEDEEDGMVEAEHSDQEKTEKELVQDSESLQDDTVSGKVTGETHSTQVGMVPELSETKPATDQPQVSLVEEKASLELRKQTTQEEAEPDTEESDEEPEDDDEDDEDDDDLIENIYEDEDDDEDDLIAIPPENLRSRDHVDTILGLDEIGTNYDLEEERLALSIFKDIKKIHLVNIKPMEMLYKYTDSTTRLLGDAEIFSKPMVLFLGPWSSGKTTIINYLLGLERTPGAFKTGTGVTDLDFTVFNHGEERRVTSGTAMAADLTYGGLQKFGQGLLDHFKGVSIPHTLLKKITIVDTPGIIESKKNTERAYVFNDAFQWFIDRADAIYVVLDPTKVDIGAELASVLDQLKGREARFILNKADTIRRSDLMRVVGQLFWNLSPLMSSAEAPVIYAVSLTTRPFHPSAPAKFLADQENNLLYDLRDTIDKYAENRILYARRHAVRVRNHCKMVDCYLSTFYRHKSIFSNKKNVAKLITENPAEYRIYDGLNSMTNVSRYDLPDPVSYKGFFKMHPLYDFKPLASTCSYFRGCPMDKLDLAISIDLPELLAKYKKAKLNIPAQAKHEGR